MDGVNIDLLRRQRFAQLQGKMAESGVDLVLSFRLENVRYISDLRPVWGEYLGMVTRYCCLATQSGAQPALFADESETSRCIENLDWISKNIEPMTPINSLEQTKTFASKKLVPRIKELGVSRGRIAIDIASLTLINELEKELPGATIVDGDF